jgi:hypothetical protein
MLAIDTLKAMTIKQRIAAVASDVESGKDEFRTIPAHDLAELLGIKSIGNLNTIFPDNPKY